MHELKINKKLSTKIENSKTASLHNCSNSYTVPLSLVFLGITDSFFKFNSVKSEGDGM